MKKVSNSLREYVKSIDMFGHPIELNFNQSGSHHNTLIGGFFSIFIRSIILFFSTIILRRMLWHQTNREM